jgi:hypothetical protein
VHIATRQIKPIACFAKQNQKKESPTDHGRPHFQYQQKKSHWIKQNKTILTQYSTQSYATMHINQT